MTDLFRLLDRLEPPQDGESPVRHRTGTVNAVNSDGTVDLDLGGIVVDSVAVLAGAFIAVGATVQVVVWRGDLLVLGAARAANQGGPLGVLGYAEVTSNQTGIGAETDLTSLSVTVDVAADRRIKITGYCLIQAQQNSTSQILFIKEGSTALQRFQAQYVNASGQEATFHCTGIEAPSSGSHTYKLALATVPSGGGETTNVLAGSDFPAFILVEDIGPA